MSSLATAPAGDDGTRFSSITAASASSRTAPLSEPGSPAPDSSLRPTHAGIVILFTLTLYLAGLNARALTFHEVFFAQPAREMLTSGNWINTTMGGVPNNEKPPLTSWVILASTQLLGESEIAVRLPFVLATVGLAWLVAWLTARWRGSFTGLLAGLILPTMSFAAIQGRLAESDILLCLWTALAFAPFLVHVDGGSNGADGRRPSVVSGTLFHGALLAGFLTKGPIVGVFVGGGIALFVLVTGRWRLLRFLFADLWQPALAAGCAGWCVWLAMSRHPEIIELWRLHNLGRFRGDMGFPQPWWFYLPTVLGLWLPWTPLIALGATLWWREADQRDRPRILLLLSWTLFGSLFLSLAVWKYKHYVMPMLPPGAVFGAIGLRRVLSLPPVSWRSVVVGAVIVTSLAGVVLISPLPGRLPGAAEATPLLVVAVVGLLMAANRAEPRRRAAVAFATAWLTLAGVFTYVVPEHDSYRDRTEFARRVNELTPGRPLVLVDQPQDQLHWYLRQPVRTVERVDAIETVAGSPRAVPVAIITTLRAARTLSGLGETREILRAERVRRRESEEERLVLLEWSPNPNSVATRRRDGAANVSNSAIR
jgi:4-amino-4-deoxy-L-arabinose transferase-like glycosyltransferase